MSSSTKREREFDNTQQQQQHQITIHTIEETKEGIHRAIEELKKETPRHLQAITDIQNQTVDATREIADSFLESQKEIINSMQTTWAPIVERTGYYYHWTKGAMTLFPIYTVDFYTRNIGAMAETNIASTRLASNLVSIVMGVVSNAIKYGGQSAKGAADIISNTAKTFAQTATKEGIQVPEQERVRETTAAEATTSTTTYASKDSTDLSGESGSARTGTGADTENTIGSTEKTTKSRREEKK
jgi:two-component sensor histidine kinase